MFDVLSGTNGNSLPTGDVDRPRLRRALLLGLLGGLLGAVLGLSPMGRELEQDNGLRWLFLWRGAQPPPREVVIVDIDPRSATRLKAIHAGRHWSRHIHGCLVRRLRQLDAAVTAFDVGFLVPRSQPAILAPRPVGSSLLDLKQRAITDQCVSASVEDEDASFAAAVHAAGRVVLFEQLTLERLRIGDLWLESERLNSPLPQLAAAAEALGPFPLPKVPNRVDSFWSFKQVYGEPIPTLPVVSLYLYVRHLVPGLEAYLEDVRDIPLSLDHRNQAEQTRQRLQALHRGLAGRSGTTPAGPLPTSDPHAAQLLRALWDALGEPERRYLNLYGPPGTLRIIPYASLFDASYILDLHGKAVFVGEVQLSSPEQHDTFYTVYSREDGIDLSGVEIAATAFANLLHRNHIRRLVPVAGFAVLFFLGLGTGLTVVLLSGTRAVVGVVLVGLGYAGLARYGFVGHYLWLPLAVPLTIQLPGLLAAGLLLQYRQARSERERSQRALRAFVPANLPQRFSKDGTPIAATELLPGTCLLTDIEDYTGLADRVAPVQLGNWTNRYFALLGVVVKRYGGIQLNTVGDASSNLWTGETLQGRQPYNACLAALGMLEEVEHLHRDLRTTGFKTRIGLHSGLVGVGSIGGGDHLSYGIIGDIANTASRIEGLNKVLGTRILASKTVVSGFDDLLVRPMGRFTLKGKRKDMEIVEVMGLPGTVDVATLDRIEGFGQGLRLFEQRSWRAAAEAFQALLDAHPEDGPSRFYLHYCHLYNNHPPDTDKPLVFQVSSK